MTGLDGWRRWLMSVAMAMAAGDAALVLELLRAALISVFIRLAAMRGISIVGA